jgi:predicted TIM-barrel fold metal-dependent hydrolase
MSHAIFMPGTPGWMESVDQAIAQLKPDSFKGYTVGDNTNKQLSKHPWRMDDEKLLYPFYEKLLKAGLVNVCVHKGLYPYSVTKRFPQLLDHADVRDVGKAAKDWPRLNFIIYDSGFRFTGGEWGNGWAQFEQDGALGLGDRPRRDSRQVRGHQVTNVYGDLGQIFAQSTVAEPRLCAAMMGMLVKGLGADHVVWGTGAIWAGAPQWQIEALRRLEIHEEMQKKYGFPALGPPDGPTKRAVFGRELGAALQVRRQAPRGAGPTTASR